MTGESVSEKATCTIVGGGPAGMVLGLLLARAGVEVRVLEKHGDFLRDFRGDTMHPTTLRLLDELGLFERFDALPHSKLTKMGFEVDGRFVTFADFRRLRGQPHPYVAMVPQWDLLPRIRPPGVRRAMTPGRPYANGMVVNRQFDAEDGRNLVLS